MKHIGAFDTMIDGLSTYRKYSSPSILTMTTDGQMDGGKDILDYRDATASENDTTLLDFHR